MDLFKANEGDKQTYKHTHTYIHAAIRCYNMPIIIISSSQTESRVCAIHMLEKFTRRQGDKKYKMRKK